METVLTLYPACFTVGILGYAIRAWCWGYRVHKHLSEAHPERYVDLVYKGLLTWPWQRGSAYRFWWRSSEDWGDPKIPEFRRECRRLFRGWVLLLVGGFAGFVALTLIATRFK